MDFIYDTLTLYESAFLERVPFQLSLHLTGAIHSVITFGNKASSLVLDCFKLITLSFVVRVPHCGSSEVRRSFDKIDLLLFWIILVVLYILRLGDQ